MSRIAKAGLRLTVGLAIAALAACTPLQNPYTKSASTASNSSSLGTASGYGSSTKMASASSAGTVAGGTIDSGQSQSLSDYLKHHQLPLVGAQVVTNPSAGKQVILFGFVASEYGKTDAEQKARKYLKDSTLIVDNRIKVSPELAGAKGDSSAGSTSTSGMPPSYGVDPYASGSVQDYQNNMPPDAYAYQQQQQYQQYNSAPPPSMLTTIIPLLGMMSGGSFGSGGFGSYGGFGSGYAPGYGSYGYPTYPPPPANSGFGYPYP
jgi:hypothetical protein